MQIRQGLLAIGVFAKTIIGGERGIRTPAGLPQSGFQDRPPKTTTNYDKSSYGKLHEPLSCQLTVSHDKPSINPPQDNAPVPSDLAPIAAAWPSIPDQIKAAVKAVLAPYLIAKGQK